MKAIKGMEYLSFITAKEAKKISESMEEKITIMDKIKDAASYFGKTEISLINRELSPYTIDFLEELGYSITKYTDTDRAQVITIKWE